MQTADRMQDPKYANMDILGTWDFVTGEGATVSPLFRKLYLAVAAVPSSSADIERNNGRAGDFISRRRANLDARSVPLGAG